MTPGPALERAAWVVLLVAAVLLVRSFVGWWQRRRAARALSGASDRLDSVTLFYFWSPDCTACRTMQKPILEALLAEPQLGPVRLRSVDVAAEPDLARQWSILTVPTTCVVAPSGQCLDVNSGLTSAPRLRNQLTRALNTSS